MKALASNGAYIRPTEKDTAPPERRDLAPFARDLWSKAYPTRGTAAQLYLDRRRIGHSKMGRYDPAAVAYEAGKKIICPALLLPITENRQIIALARVFLDRDGQKSPRLVDPKRTLGDPRGGCIQIGTITDHHLNLAEGFEEAESVIAHFGLAGCWSVNGSELYSRIAIPDSVRSITIYSQHGKAAHEGVQKAMPNLLGEGRQIDVRLPPEGGDWNDDWVSQ